MVLYTCDQITMEATQKDKTNVSGHPVNDLFFEKRFIQARYAYASLLFHFSNENSIYPWNAESCSHYIQKQLLEQRLPKHAWREHSVYLRHSRRQLSRIFYCDGAAAFCSDVIRLLQRTGANGRYSSYSFAARHTIVECCSYLRATINHCVLKRFPTETRWTVMFIF